MKGITERLNKAFGMMDVYVAGGPAFLLFTGSINGSLVMIPVISILKFFPI